MANVKVTQDNNGVRWLELMRNGSGTLLEIRNDEEAMQIMVALQQSVQATGGESAEQTRIENELSEWGNPSRPSTRA